MKEISSRRQIVFDLLVCGLPPLTFCSKHIFLDSFPNEHLKNISIARLHTSVDAKFLYPVQHFYQRILPILLAKIILKWTLLKKMQLQRYVSSVAKKVKSYGQSDALNKKTWISYDETIDKKIESIEYYKNDNHR